MGKMILMLSALSMVFGLLMMAFPKILVSSAIHHTVITLDKVVVKYHVGMGVCLILASIFLFSYGYYLGWR